MSNGKITINPFGEIDINALEECYEAEITVEGNNGNDIIELDINFEDEQTDDIESLNAIKMFIDNMDKFVQKTMDILSEDFELAVDDGTARFYLEHHFEVCEKEELLELFATLDIDKPLFMSKLALYRVGFYPEDEESFAVFDVQFPRDFTDYLMAVTFDKNGNCLDISLES